ncbi:MAG: multidrug ABC transporter ATP-binding protein, partial [Spirochaetales bacterium]
QNEGTMVMIQVMHGLINAGVLILFMVILDLRMGAVVLAGLLLFLIVNIALRKKSERLYPVRHEAQISIVGAVLEYVQGISVIRSFNLAKMARGKLAEAVKNCEKQNLALELAFIPLLMLQSLVFKASSIAVIILSLVFYIDGSMSTPMVILMIIASFVVFKEIELSGATSSLSMLAERAIADVKAQLAVPVMSETGKNTESSGFDIRCENVSFSYEKRKVIDNLSLEIKEKTTTAIVGPSGGGKTTICRLIARFWDVDEGRITLGGKDIRDYKPDDLLGRFSMVFQNVYLFNDTIANNIKFGRPDATEEEVREAARKACYADFIEALPNGYDTVIGEGGATISGGEKQRISIAR